MNELQIFNIGGVDCYEKDGIAYLKLETVARGLGFTQNKNGVEYIKWERISGYLGELGYSPKVGKDSFIPENVFYRLAMKAKNEVAEKFQAKVADEIIPSIRKNGIYATDNVIEKIINDPDFGIKLLNNLKEEKEKNKRLEHDNQVLEAEAIEMSKTISGMQPKVNYVDTILKSKSTVCTTQIAQDYGMSAKAFNNTLKDLGIQRKVNDQWILYGKYQGQGYVHSDTINITRKDGSPDTVMNTKWTQKGRLFLYEELKKCDIYPMIERYE